jgi:tagatose 1,6-diphosphate aldolase
MESSIGKRRGLGQCSTIHGVFGILALDHRGNLRQILNPQSPELVTYEEIVAFKMEVTAALSPHSSAVLLDPEFGSGQAVTGCAISGTSGLIVAVEATGYEGRPTSRVSRVLPDWSVAKIKRMGASGVKLLLYYHPLSELAVDQENLVRIVADECRKHDIPLFLEPLSYSLDPGRQKLSSDELRYVVTETARRLTPLGVDILKAEFPLDIKEESDEQVWLEACREISSASVVPWALLSAGVDFEDFLRQVNTACRSGASGILAGRAVWKEAGVLTGADRTNFLQTTATNRMQRLTGLCNAFGKPWKVFYPSFHLGEGWYKEYEEY